jgi:hypothetical protein
VHGDQGDTTAATDTTAAGTETTNAATTEQIPTEARWMGSEKVIDDRLVSTKPVPRVRTFSAKPCTSCEALREVGTNFTRVFATRGNVRYCRCHFCGNTWKDSES